MSRKKKDKLLKTKVQAPGFGESMVEIINLAGQTDFKTYTQSNNKTRLFKDDKGVFQEMKDKRKKGKTIIVD